jgi:hypothetical protein
MLHIAPPQWRRQRQGANLERVFTLWTMSDTLAMRASIDGGSVKNCGDKVEGLLAWRLWKLFIPEGGTLAWP